jgi:PAS domain S-box-containing protein
VTATDPESRSGDDLTADELALVLEAANAGTFRTDLATGEVRLSPSLAALDAGAIAPPPRTMADFLPFVHPDDRGPLRAAMRRTLDEGGPGGMRVRLVLADGTVRHCDARWRLVTEETGGPTLIGIVRDVSGEQRAFEQTRFLAEVSAVLDASLDLDTTLGTLAELCVPAIADWCWIDVADAELGIRNVAVAHVDPGKVALTQELRARYPPDPEGPAGAPNVLRTGEPELYPEVTEAIIRAGAVDDQHYAMVSALDMTSAIVVPLHARGAVLGALTLVRTDKRARFTSDDLPFTGEVAARAGVAIDNAAVYGALLEQRDLYEALLVAQSELGQAFVLLEGTRVVYSNAAAVALTGRTAEELGALPSVFEVVPADRREVVGERILGVYAGRQPEEAFRTEVERPDGSRVPVEAAGHALGGAMSGRMLIIARDISARVERELELERVLTEEQAARRTSEQARERERLLSDASALLERAPADENLQAVAALVAGRLAEACTIDILDPGGALRRAGAAATDPGARARLIAADDEGPIRAVIEAGRRVASGAPEDALGPRTLRMPLIARGRPVGVLSLGWSDAERRGPAEEGALVAALAQRVALAVDAAQQYRQRAHIAQTLQASLLPTALPAIAGAQIAAEYLAAGEGFEVGGDFYDAFALGGGAWALVIGDVLGKGPEAAAVTALARHTLRAISDRRLSPAATLAALNEHMLRQVGERRFVTMLLAHLQVGPSGTARLAAATGGHPPALVLRADGDGEPLEVGGPLLGVHADVACRDVEAVLAPGDTIVLYTDGVTEARRTDPLTPAALARLLAPTASDGPAAVAREVVRIARERSQGTLRDDLAVLAVRIEAGQAEGAGAAGGVDSSSRSSVRQTSTAIANSHGRSRSG